MLNLFGLLLKDKFSFVEEIRLGNVVLKIATEEDMQMVWEMQVKAFSGLLEKYQDYDITVGVIRVIDRKDGCRTNIRV